MLLTWEPPPCDPPETLTYRVYSMADLVIGSIIGPDSEPEPVYQMQPRMLMTETLELSADVAIPDPAIGEAVFVDIESVDLAGNESIQECL